MPTEKLPPFLEDEANQLRVTWRKSLNYFSSFSTLWFELKAKFDSGEFDDRRNELKFGGSTFDAWAAEIGFPTEFISKVCKAHETALAEEHRIQLDLVIALKRKQRREEVEQRRGAKEAKSKQKAINEEQEKKKQRRDEYRRQKRIMIIKRGPKNVALRELLEATAYVRGHNLGNCYSDIRNMVFEEVEGKDEYGHPWTWERWVEAFIGENPDPRIRNDAKTVNNLIQQYIDTLPEHERPWEPGPRREGSYSVQRRVQNIGEDAAQ
jgi:hypothetical protein